jgi:hypothetical protein
MARRCGAVLAGWVRLPVAGIHISAEQIRLGRELTVDFAGLLQIWYIPDNSG